MGAASIRDRLLHIARSIDAVEGYWAGKTFQDFEASEPLRAATERRIWSVVNSDLPDLKAAVEDITKRDAGE